MDKSAVYDELKRNPKKVRFNRYAIEIFYSEEDEGYIAIVPELPECSAFGETEEEALKEIKVAIDLWLETIKKDGREIPEPTGKELLRNVGWFEGMVSKRLEVGLVRSRLQSFFKGGSKIVKNKEFLYNIFIIVFLLMLFILIILINHDTLGPTFKEDKKLIIKYDDININGHGAGSYRIEGWYKSKGIISANKNIEVSISYVDYTFDKYYFKSELGIFNLPDNINASICPENAVDINGLNKKTCINVILKKEDHDNFIFYINQSLIKKDMQFLTSGKQLLTISPDYLLQIHVKDVFEIEPTYVNAELQLNKYAFMLALIGLFVSAIEIIRFSNYNKLIIIVTSIGLIVIILDFIDLKSLLGM